MVDGSDSLELVLRRWPGLLDSLDKARESCQCNASVLVCWPSLVFDLDSGHRTEVGSSCCNVRDDSSYVKTYYLTVTQIELLRCGRLAFALHRHEVRSSG